MANLNIRSLAVQALGDEHEVEQEYSQAAELAWEYCNKIRHGEKPQKMDYRKRLSNEGEREEFDFLVGMNEFVEHAVDYQVVNEGP